MAQHNEALVPFVDCLVRMGIFVDPEGHDGNPNKVKLNSFGQLKNGFVVILELVDEEVIASIDSATSDLPATTHKFLFTDSFKHWLENQLRERGFFKTWVHVAEFGR